MTSRSWPCSAAYNPVVLRATTADAWWVYLVPGTTRHEILPASGFRVDVDVTGTRILGSRAFTRSCVVLENRPNDLFLMLGHMLDASPTELHVFLSLMARKPLLIATSANQYGWEIRNGKIVAASRIR